MKYRVVLAYDGTNYLGWQRTKTGPSIQETVEGALLKITQQKVCVEAASRTDRGVHAEGQVIHCRVEKNIEPLQLQRALLALLPVDIRVLEITPTSETFHATLNAKKKEYHYRVCLGPVQEPLYRLYSWHCPYALNFKHMYLAARDLCGTHDFSAFANRPLSQFPLAGDINDFSADLCVERGRHTPGVGDEREQKAAKKHDLNGQMEFRKGSNKKEPDPVCILDQLAILSLPSHRLQISIQGNRFLYKMARNIVGFLIDVGRGKLSFNKTSAILASCKRANAGVCAPAHGLFLHKVFYDHTQ